MKKRLLITAGIITLFLLGIYWAYDASQLYVFRAESSSSYTYNLLFDSVSVIAIPIAILIGIFFGSLKSNKGTTKLANGKILRHDEETFIKHWSHVLGTLVLLITGIMLGALFIPRSVYSIKSIAFTLNMHFISILFFLFGLSFYVTKALFTGELKKMMPQKGDITGAINHYKAMIFGKENPKEKKFMAVERIIFPFWIIFVGGIVITGVIKVSAHIWDIPGSIMSVTTTMHDVFAIGMALMVPAHIIGAALLPASWPLLRSMLTGYVKEDYAKHHHELWYEEILENSKDIEFDNQNITKNSQNDKSNSTH